MAVVITGKEYTPAPEGVHNAVCVDVADLGMVSGQFGTQHKVKIVWELEEEMEDGRRFTVQKWYTASLHEKSNLAKDLRAWRGKPFSQDELKEFDLEKVMGAPCQLVVVHNDSDNGQTYANVQTILKAGATKLKPTGDYVRHKDRDDRDTKKKPTKNGKPANRSEDYEPAASADEIPF